VQSFWELKLLNQVQQSVEFLNVIEGGVYSKP